MTDSQAHKFMSIGELAADMDKFELVRAPSCALDFADLLLHLASVKVIVRVAYSLTPRVLADQDSRLRELDRLSCSIEDLRGRCS